MGQRFDGTIGRTFAESEAWWPPLPTRARRCAERRVVLLDDVGLRAVRLLRLRHRDARRFDRLAASGRALRATSTPPRCARRPAPACSPDATTTPTAWRASSSWPSGFPGYNATIPKENGFLSEILRDEGYATFAVGKWHLAPGHRDGRRQPARQVAARPRLRPLLRVPRRRDRPVPPRARARQPSGRAAAHARGGLPPHRGPRRPRDPLPADLRGASTRPSRSSCGSRPARATRRIRRRRSTSSATAAGSTRAGTLARRRCSRARSRRACCRRAPSCRSGRRGCRRGTRSPPTSGGCTPGMMEVYAGFLTHTDAQVGRVLDFIDELGETDNTIVHGHERQRRVGRGRAERLVQRAVLLQLRAREHSRRTSAASTTSARPRANNHYPWGWAWAGNTPLKRFKRDTHEGGVCRSADRPLAGAPRARTATRATSTCTPSTCCRRCSS